MSTKPVSATKARPGARAAASGKKPATSANRAGAKPATKRKGQVRLRSVYRPPKILSYWVTGLMTLVIGMSVLFGAMAAVPALDTKPYKVTDHKIVTGPADPFFPGWQPGPLLTTEKPTINSSPSFEENLQAGEKRPKAFSPQGVKLAGNVQGTLAPLARHTPESSLLLKDFLPAPASKLPPDLDSSLLPSVNDQNQQVRQSVILGTSLLSFSQLYQNASTLPKAWSQARLAKLITRTHQQDTCPVAGWLTLGAGARASASGALCELKTWPGGSNIPGFAPLAARVASDKPNTKICAVAQALAQSKNTSLGIGAGAALFLCQPSGQTSNPILNAADIGLEEGRETWGQNSDGKGKKNRVFWDLVAKKLWDRVGDQSLVVIDLNEFAPTAPTQLDLANALIASSEKPGRQITLTSVGSKRAELGIFAQFGAGVQPGYAYSDSVRQIGTVQMPDITATILANLGITPSPVVMGDQVSTAQTSFFAPVPYGQAVDFSERISALYFLSLKANAMNLAVPVFVLSFLVLSVLVFYLALWVSRWVRPAGALAWAKFLRASALALALAIPGTFLASLLPWWSVSSPVLRGVLGGLTPLALGALLAAFYLIIRLFKLISPAFYVAGITAVVIGGDVLTRAGLIVDSPAGVQSVVAGRFYGLSNTAYVFFITAYFIIALGIVSYLQKKTKLFTSLILVALLGIIVVLIDVLPDFGADFGGAIALIPGLVMFLVLLAQKQLRFWRVCLALIFAFLLVIGVSLMDWLLGGRSHLARFIDAIIDGGAWNIIVDKATLLWRATLPWYVVLALVLLCLLLCVFALLPLYLEYRGIKTGAYRVFTAGEPLYSFISNPWRATLSAWSFTIVLATLVNDSSLVILGYGLVFMTLMIVSQLSEGFLVRTNKAKAC